jgi:hypothetical protein
MNLQGNEVSHSSEKESVIQLLNTSIEKFCCYRYQMENAYIITSNHLTPGV